MLGRFFSRSTKKPGPSEESEATKEPDAIERPEAAEEPQTRTESEATRDSEATTQFQANTPEPEANAAAANVRAVEEEAGTAQPEPQKGWLSRLKAGLTRSSSQISEGITGVFSRSTDQITGIFRKRKLDRETLDQLEELLIRADLGPATAASLVEELARDRFDKEVSEDEVRLALAESIAAILDPLATPLVIDRTRKPHVVLVVGVNGSGKTTTIGKLAAHYRRQGLSVMVAAGDTFRAAAVEQLKVWSERSGASFFATATGDAAGLAFDALKTARAQGTDLVLIDTAGRLHNKEHLMAELDKILRVIKKIDPSAPHDSVLVLDATTGQNALSQVEIFRSRISGLIVTKLDGTARGGVLVALAERFGLPVHAIGVGESIDDLDAFTARDFARSLMGLG
jgi:fused signal recognition particle receptor